MAQSDEVAMSLEAISWRNGKLEILDQTVLPGETRRIVVDDVKAGWEVINKMQVRGAPAIAIVGCLSLVTEIQHLDFKDKEHFLHEIKDKLNYLISARPTAVNMKIAADELMTLANRLIMDNVVVNEMKQKFINTIIAMLEKDIADNNAIGNYGAQEILSNVPQDSFATILTHCNTGSLATAGYGTALGVIRSLHARKKLKHVYFTETRPYLQGARLTAYELVHDKIPATLICDNMVAALLKMKQITAVVVGADRVAANGDTANKIGTYQIALLAKYHSVPFYVAAPRTSIDFTTASGDHIIIEERPDHEMTHINGHKVTPPGIQCWNPAFDVTPAHLIAGIITEVGVYRPADLIQLKAEKKP